MRIKILKNINGVKLHPYKDVPKQTDETEERGFYQYLISVPIENFEAVEYELRKAQRNDDRCNFKEIIRTWI